METPAVLPAHMTPEQAAAYLGVTAGTLAVWRCTRKHALPYLKVGARVRYRKVDLDTWLEQRRVAA